MGAMARHTRIMAAISPPVVTDPSITRWTPVPRVIRPADSIMTWLMIVIREVVRAFLAFSLAQSSEMSS